MSDPKIEDFNALVSQLREREKSLSVELELKNEMLSALKYTVVSTIGGTDYEGFPTSEINYLQRLRILVEKEAQLADERKHGDRLVEALKIAHDRTECEHDRINIGDEDPCPVCDLLAAHTERRKA